MNNKPSPERILLPSHNGRLVISPVIGALLLTFVNDAVAIFIAEIVPELPLAYTLYPLLPISVNN